MNYVLYHKNCQDGTMSAAVCKLAGIVGEYIAVTYNEDFAIDMTKLTKDDVVYIVDFSYPRDILVEVNKLVGKLVVLDHHESAQKELSHLPYATFDMKKCGAMLTWHYFFPNDEPPVILKWIQEYDLWTKSDCMADIINFGLGAQPWVKDPAAWVNLLTNFSDVSEHILSAGEAIISVVDGIKNSYINNQKKVKIIDLAFGGDTPDGQESVSFKVGVANVTEYPNEVAQAIYDYDEWETETGYVDFVILYHLDAEGRVKLSFRGNKVRSPNLSVIASALFGGGGHPCSSAARLNKDDSREWLLKTLY